jgi:hypothetical protein
MFRTRRLLFNSLTFVPGVSLVPAVRRKLRSRTIGTGGTDSARYCYSVWMRHLFSARENGLNTNPETVAELGPGDSLGISLAALLSGAARCFAFDVVAHASAARDLAIFNNLVSMFECRAAIPDDVEFPGAFPKLKDYRFPVDILTNRRIETALAPERVRRIRDSLTMLESNDSLIRYRAPWYDASVVKKDSVDMIFSQAVLEHVDDLEMVYRTMNQWLTTSGYVSHQIDLKSHGWAEEWNGHWTYSDFMWKLIRGRDSWLINREPRSTHIRLLTDTGFRIVSCESFATESRIGINDLAKRFRGMSEEDLRTSGLFVQAMKR